MKMRNPQKWDISPPPPKTNEQIDGGDCKQCILELQNYV